ncbi:uncharacterized protein [Rutidosis leptorrhynchoides]|uniref:uncharacterized protein n=1 Tax=Rutidosis leptorrhynchoides TaxID=125765 RepID=UPI003A98D635
MLLTTLHIPSVDETDLIDWQSASWKFPLLRQLFPSQIVGAIQSTPIADLMRPDQHLWSPSQEATLGDVSFQHWNNVWALKLPPYVKHFSWKLCKGLIGSKENLIRRGRILPSHCEICYDSEENLLHLFKSCYWSISMFGLLGAVFDLACACVGQSVDDMKCWMLDLNCIDQVAMIQSPIVLDPLPDKWAPPGEAYFKINFDRAFTYGSTSNRFGFIVRDYRGNIIHAEAGSIGAAEDAFNAETVAAWRALSWASIMQVQHIVLKGDCSLLIQEYK